MKNFVPNCINIPFNYIRFFLKYHTVLIQLIKKISVCKIFKKRSQNKKENKNGKKKKTTILQLLLSNQ